MLLSSKIAAIALAVGFLCSSTCYAASTTEILNNMSMTDGTIESANNTLYFFERNPGRITFTDNGYTGAYYSDQKDHLFCVKNGVSVKFTPEYLSKWQSERANTGVEAAKQLEQAAKDFLYAYENKVGYDQAFYHTNDIREVFVFEAMISEALSNTLLSARQGNIIDVDCDDSTPDSFTIKMNSATKVEKFRHEIAVTNQVLNECDALVSSILNPFEKIKQINNFATKKLTYNSEKVDKGYGALEAHSDIDALCYGTGTVCAGYCNLFQLLCERYGIQTENVENDPNSEGYHAWSANLIDGN